MVKLINKDQIAILLDDDGDKVIWWDHAPTEAEIVIAIEEYRYKSHSPFTLFLAARKEVWESGDLDNHEQDTPYKIFEQTNEVIKDAVKFGKRKVVVR